MSRNINKLIILVAIALLAVSCEDQEDATRHDLSGQGVACIHTGDMDDTIISELSLASDSTTVTNRLKRLSANIDLSVSVAFSLPTSSAFSRQASCETTIEGRTIVIHSLASYEMPNEVVWELDSMAAHCHLGSLSPGDWVLQYGDYSTTFTLTDEVLDSKAARIEPETSTPCTGVPW